MGACCNTIMPLRVTQWAGDYSSFGGALVLVDYIWSPVYDQFIADRPELRISSDWDEAFEDLGWHTITSFPEELKAECIPLTDGSDTFQFEFAWPNSSECGGDDGDYATAFGGRADIVLRLKVCAPVTMKAVIISEVEDWGVSRVLGSTTYGKAAFDYTEVYAGINSLTTHPESVQCSDPPEAPTFWERVAFTHARSGGDPCDSSERLDCGVYTFCEGEYYIWIRNSSGDGKSNSDQTTQVTLEFVCGNVGTLDCDDEEDDPRYDPPDEPELDPPDPPTTDPPDPPEVDPDTLPCICGTCRQYALVATISGLVNSGCLLLPISENVNTFVESLNREFTLTYDDVAEVWAQDLGTENDINDPGILLQTRVGTSDPENPDDDLQFDVYTWRVEHTGLACSGDELTGTGLLFRQQCWAHHPLTPAIGGWAVGTDCTVCARHNDFSTVFSSTAGTGCSGELVLSNDWNNVLEPAGTICTCVEDDSSALLSLSPGGVAATC